MREEDVVGAIRALLDEAHTGAAKPLVLGIGDDAALWQPSRSNRSAISSDMLVENVHFRRDGMRLHDIGWRAMAANLSDLAAMGARPVLATVALGIPPGFEQVEILELYRGLAAAARDGKLGIAGGDLSRAPALVIAISVVGEVRASNVKTRSGGRPGDVLAVTGPLGGARAGLEVLQGASPIADEPAAQARAAFCRPRARLAAGRFFAASANVDAMMDLSDGLAVDAGRLARASGCGVRFERIPVCDAALAVAQATGEDPQRFALAGGEDFELLVAVRPRAFAHVATRYQKRFGNELLKVGRLVAEPGLCWMDAPLDPIGWDHFAPGR